MNSDRELLELAAKAAGIEIYFDEDGGSYRVKASGNRNYWNPLLFDGDALRLAVKLNIQIDSDTFNKDTVVLFSHDLFSGDLDAVTEVHGADPYAATRRAVVRAAAEIGRSME